MVYDGCILLKASYRSSAWLCKNKPFWPTGWKYIQATIYCCQRPDNGQGGKMRGIKTSYCW